MAQANAIIVRIRVEAAEEFQRLFDEEELPIWDEFVSEGTFLKARFARLEYGTEEREDVALYRSTRRCRGWPNTPPTTAILGSTPSSRKRGSSNPKAHPSSAAT